MAVAAQNCKLISVTPPAAIVDNASFTTAEVDTLGFDYAKYVVYIGATDIAFTACAITESNSSGSGHANVTGLIWGTSADIAGTTSTLPSATDDNKFFVFDINLLGRKRYLDLTLTIGDGTSGGFAAVWCELSRAEDTPTTAAQRGAAQILRV